MTGGAQARTPGPQKTCHVRNSWRVHMRVPETVSDRRTERLPCGIGVSCMVDARMECGSK